MTRPPADLVPAEVPAHPLAHNPLNGVTGGIWRTRRAGRPAVLKVIAPPGAGAGPAHWAASDDAGHWNYWRREVEAYRSGLAVTCYADAGLVAPHPLAIDDRPDGTVALWLTEAVGRPGTAGTAKHFWLAPVTLNRAGGATGQTYDRRDEAAMFAGRRPVLELLARWAAASID